MKKDESINENNNYKSTCLTSGLRQLCLQLLPVSSLLYSENMQTEKRRNVMHNISIIARLFLRSLRPDIVLTEGRGITVAPDWPTTKTHSRVWIIQELLETGIRTRSRRSMGPKIRGLTSCHLSEFLLAKKKEISCCVWLKKFFLTAKI